MKKLLIGLLCLASTSQAARIHYDGPASENFIIRWAFQAICDHEFDLVKNYGVCPASEGKKVTFDPEDVKPGDIVFVRDFKTYFKQKHQEITVPYFILTHGEFRDKFKKKYLKYLEDDRILAWFTIHPIAIEHERVIPLPLGVVQHKKNHDRQKQTHENFMKLRARNKEKLLYMNFTEWHMPFRTRIRKIFEDKPFCTYAKRCSFEKFMTDLASHKFAVSPPGLGPDCYRVWECVMVGTIPIVEHSYLDYLYEGLPVLFIDDWEEVTEEFLNRKYREMTAKIYSQKTLSMEHWVDVIDSVRKKFWPSDAGPFRPLLNH